MISAAKNSFDSHIEQCNEAVEIYKYLEANGYIADFGLRFVWVAAMSALDNYVSELIIEKATKVFSNDGLLSNKLETESVPFGNILNFQSSTPAEATVAFRNLISNAVKFQTFQKADSVAAGLAYIWNEKHKWKFISDSMSMPMKSAKGKLNSICYRRDAIVHNADYDMASNKLRGCNLEDAMEASNFVTELVGTIDNLVFSV